MSDQLPFEVFHIREVESMRHESGKSYLSFLQRPGFDMGLYRVSAGTSDKETHGTHEQDEVYFVVSGRGRISLDEHDQELSPGTVVFVQEGAVHYFHCVVEDLTLLVFFSG